jgi:organic radical activating enzyme
VPAKLCTSAFGSEFWCDTDYSKHTEVPVEDLLEETYERHVCWTGGEPLMHQAREWMIALNSLFRLRGIQQHVETSGTVPFRMAFDWITVSPKESWRQDVVREADQIKFLVDEQFSLERADEITQLAPERCLVYLSPIFDPNLPVPGNVKLALAYLTQRPQWRLNIQWHKFLGLR